MDMRQLDMFMKSSFGYKAQPQTEHETQQFEKLFNEQDDLKYDDRKRLVSDDIFKEIDD